MSVFAYMYIYTLYVAWFSWRAEECIRTPGTGVTGIYEPPCGYSARAASAHNH